MRSVLDGQLARGSDNFVYWYSEAQYALLTGDEDAAIAHLQTSLDKGIAGVGNFDPVFDPIRNDERFVAFEAEALRRANAERTALGLGPYKPPIQFN